MCSSIAEDSPLTPLPHSHPTQKEVRPFRLSAEHS